MKLHIASPSHTETAFVSLDTGRCQACWACVEICPEHVLGKVDVLFHRHARVDRPADCRGCLRCLKACSNQAILVRRKTHGNASR